MRQFVLNHWKGQTGFNQTLYIHLIGFAFLFSLVETDTWPLWVICMWLGFVILVLIWQLMGGFRRAKHTNNGNAWRMYLGMLIACIFMGLQSLDIVANQLFQPQRAKTIFGNDDFSVRYKSKTIYAGGEINYLMYQAILAILSQQEQVDKLELDSHGGIVFAARSIGKLVQQHNLKTTVTNKCYSACTLVFAAGNQRILANTGKLGFHGYSFDMPYRFQTVDPIAEQQKDKLYLMAKGISAEFLGQAFNTSAKELWTPTRSELFTAGFISAP